MNSSHQSSVEDQFPVTGLPRVFGRFWVLALFGLIWAPSAWSQVAISEFMASNAQTLSDEDGDYPDWIEIVNAGATTVQLGGMYLTDDAGLLSKWQFPTPTFLAANSYLVIYASDKDRTTAGQELHTNFKLKSEGEYLALVDSDGISVVDEYSPEYPEQYQDISYGLEKDPPFAAQYFSQPTPGSQNGNGGPVIREVTHFPTVLQAGQDLRIEAVPTDLGLNGQMELYYRILYGSEVSLTMTDDGTNGDLVAGDNRFTAVISASAYAAGDMLRYFVLATDSSAGTGREPVFQNPLSTPEYLGTMVQDPAVQSTLDVLYWFVEDPIAAQTLTGTRCSVYYRNEFYDNLYVRIRGSSALQWPKPNYKFDFNRGYSFEFDSGYDRVGEINLNSTYSDKSFVRRFLSWETYRDAGAYHCLSFPLRVQQNGQFHSVAAFVEQPDEDYLERQALDPSGALYKMFNAMIDAYNGVEKKTRQFEDHSDLEDFINGVVFNPTARAEFLFDNVDIPATINYLATTSIIHDNDHVEKNYYLYRDSEGDKEWTILPWDKDLTFGRNFVPPDGVLNDVMWADLDPYGHPLYGDIAHRKVDGVYNLLINALYGTPEIQELYLRRLRTLMDQLLQEPNTPAQDLRFEQRLTEWHSIMASDVALDEAAWGIPSWGTLPLDFAGGLQQIQDDYLGPRRLHLFQTHAGGSGILPEVQPENPSIGFGSVEADPLSGNQLEEYIELQNPNSFAVDVSGWSLGDGVDFVFAPGTVIGSQGSLFVSPDQKTFRARSSGPGGNQKLLVVGPYQGFLEPQESLSLFDQSGELVNTTAGPVLNAINLAAQQTAVLSVRGTTPSALQVIAYSLVGNGPTQTPYGIVSLSPPIVQLPAQNADAAGIMTLAVPIPAGTSGTPVWLQAYDSGTGVLTNALAEIVQ